MTKKTVNIGKTAVGGGRPKICVPVTGTAFDDVINQIKHVCSEYDDIVDIVELRIDYYDGAEDGDKVRELLTEARKHMGTMPLLFTFRSAAEGGEKEITDEVYESLLTEAVSTGMTDAVDLELMRDEAVFDRVLAAAHRKGVAVVASSHDFYGTPSEQELIERLSAMQKRGADIAKIAVMPNSQEDVLTLLAASLRADRLLDIPVIAISMGRLGTLSRIGGGMFGSALTFGVADKASAPGQPDARELKRALELLHG